MENTKLSLVELSELSGVSRRTIRYYIQLKLVPPPCGKLKGAYYTQKHLDELLRVVRLTKLHVPLDEIPLFDEALPQREAEPQGTVTTYSHVSVLPGVELVINPSQASLPPERLRAFSLEILKIARKFEAEAAEEKMRAETNAKAEEATSKAEKISKPDSDEPTLF